MALAMRSLASKPTDNSSLQELFIYFGRIDRTPYGKLVKERAADTEMRISVSVR